MSFKVLMTLTFVLRLIWETCFLCSAEFVFIYGEQTPDPRVMSQFLA